ncbi:hypothetical protein HBH70_078010 [Parastagonospora nodorum]|nr:hypothetical protein HBH52_071020 [Parastagonospora nodorum]KAH4045814.1 hypothetical protein HBH49_195850 [Parastagonospora nodorum]KAH4069752.1 hypothetical protein HBH50_103840 [Parastagonospora nodorum]KAH4090160.1 hypothetical protein HBH48_107610 [Parastagonospora nodorum]KAH4264751.1 hypothetical protein HBI03_088830 [Parastagonospora nodorum]
MSPQASLRRDSASPTPSSTSSVFSTSTSNILTAASSVMSVSPTPTKQHSPGPASASASALQTADPMSKPSSVQKLDVTTNLSYCTPTSLAFFKELAWEQTPWIRRSTKTKMTNPILPEDAAQISKHLEVDQEAIEHALLFGSTSTDLQLFVIFPHATDYAVINERFLTIWHDEIVKPAFDRAWKDSGLVRIHGAMLESRVRILPPKGVRTENDALPASDIIRRFRLNSTQIHAQNWPSGNPAIMHDAWESIAGMLRGYPGLEEYQDPKLLAVYRAGIDLNEKMSTPDWYEIVRREWDADMDGEYVVKGSFGVLLKTSLGKKKDGTAVVQKKRKSTRGYGDEEESRKIGNEEDRHQAKRRKVVEDV